MTQHEMKIETTTRTCPLCADPVPEADGVIGFVGFVDDWGGEQINPREVLFEEILEHEVLFVAHRHCVEQATKEQRDALFANKRKDD